MGAKWFSTGEVENFICGVGGKGVSLQRQNNRGPSGADNREPCENHGLTRNCNICKGVRNMSLEPSGLREGVHAGGEARRPARVGERSFRESKHIT